MSDSRQTKTIIKGLLADRPPIRYARLGDEYHTTDAVGGGDVYEASPDPADTTQLLWKLVGNASGDVPDSRLINTTLPLTGGGDLSANRTLGINPATTAAAGSLSASDKAKLDQLQTGTVTLVGGQSTVNTANIRAGSAVMVSRNLLPGGGTAIGLLRVHTIVIGTPGSFQIEANAEANQAVVAADTSTVVWAVIN